MTISEFLNAAIAHLKGLKFYRFTFIPTLVFCLLTNFSLVADNGDTIWVELQKGGRHYFSIENVEYSPVKKPRVGLVLSGGGARGFAHIGVLKALEERQIELDLVVGTSMGSIVGGFYCAGFSADQITRIAGEIDWDDIISDATQRPHLFLSQKNIPRRHIVQLRMDGIVPYIPQSITQGQKVYQTMYRRLLQAEFQAHQDFDNLKIPFRSVTTDLNSGNKVVLGSGNLAEAIQASMAFPLMFAPVEINGMRLVDGGITDNLPVDVARNLGMDIVIGVDATSPLRGSGEMEAPWEIADQVTTIMMENPTRESFLKADLGIKPPLKDYRAGDFNQMDSIIRTGYEAAIGMIDSLNMLIDKKTREFWGENVSLGTVREVEHRGKFLHGEIAYQLNTHEGKNLFRHEVLSDLQQIYRSGHYRDVKARVIRNGEECRITFFLEEQPRVEEISFRHSHILPDSVLMAAVEKFRGQILNVPELERSLIDIRRRLIWMGYALAEIRSVRFDPDSARLEIEIDEGRIEEIQIQGNHTTRRSVILREFPIREGEYFRSAIAVQGIQSLFSTDLFDRVTLNVLRESGKNVLTIKVRERKYLLMRLGGHASLERKSEGLVELLHDNFLGTGIKFNVMGAIGDYLRYASSSLYTTRLLSTFLTSRLSFYYEERSDRYFEDFEQKGEYVILRRGTQFMLGQQIGRLGLISLQLRLENIHTSSHQEGFPYSDSYRLRSFTVRSEVDKRDRLPFPRRGIYNRWFWETGNQSVLGGSISFTRIFIGLEGYYQFLRLFNYHPYLYAGSADITLPFSEFFHFGGQKNFPGLYEREKFGRQFVMTGIDLRYQIDWNLPIEAYILTNYSTAAAWARPDQPIEGSDFLHSFSVSLALNSLLGPVQATYSRLYKERNLFYFSLGFDF